MTVSSALVRDKVLNPAMDSLVHNRHQYNGDPELNSVLEWALHDCETGAPREKVARHIRAAMASNVLEGEATGEVAGFSDRLATDLHRVETETGADRFATTAICQRLRDPLKVVRDPSGCSAREITFAHLIVKDAVREIPATVLLKDSVRRELGVKLTTTLESYIGQVDA